MEKIEFIAEAKKRGYNDSDIRNRLNLHDRFVEEGYPMNYESFFGAIEPDEIDNFMAGPPAPALSA